MIFQVANLSALAGWIALGLSVILRREPWRETIAGRAIPLALSALYLVLIAFFFGRAEGGFDSLANVQKLFTYPWAALAGWVHYLAFDLFIGAWIARQSALEQLPRWPLAIILPLTFIFGPIGLIAFYVTSRLLRRPSTTAV
ncbi:MAG: ABA4-like family protein [Aestuariivirga sp.]